MKPVFIGKIFKNTVANKSTARQPLANPHAKARLRGAASVRSLAAIFYL
jgi:hypothetical protein